jgi:hypothetical protein
MIPDELVRHLNGPVLAFAGSRDRRLHPFATITAGLRVDAPRDTIEFLVPHAEGDQILAGYRDNGRIALTVVEPISHTTYQFKGRFLADRPASEDDRALHDIFKAKASARLESVGYRRDLVYGYAGWPATAVTMRVEDIFVQTPGPGAGKRIAFEASP